MIFKWFKGRKKTKAEKMNTKIIKQKRLKGRAADRLALHLNLNRMGLLLKTNERREEVDKLIFAIAYLFEDRKYFNEIAQSAALKAFYLSGNPVDAFGAYFSVITSLPDEVVLDCITTMKDDFALVLLEATTKIKFTLVENIEEFNKLAVEVETISMTLRMLREVYEGTRIVDVIVVVQNDFLCGKTKVLEDGKFI